MVAVGSVYDAPEEGFYIRLLGGASGRHYLGSDDLKEMVHNITKYNEWWEYIRKNSIEEFTGKGVCYYEDPPLYNDSNKTLKELKKDLEEEGLYDEEEWAELREECEIEKLNVNFCYDAYVFLSRERHGLPPKVRYNDHSVSAVSKRMIYERLIKDSPHYEELKKKDDKHISAVLKQFGTALTMT